MFIQKTNLLSLVLSLTLSFLLALTAALPSAAAPAPFDSTDFLVADFDGGRIAVYDQNFVFKGYLDSGFSQVAGLDFLPNGNLIASGYDPMVRTYDRNGTVLTEFTTTSLGSPREIKVASANKFYVATQDPDYSLGEFDASGALIRSLGLGSYSSVAVVSGDKVWTGSTSMFGTVEVYDTTNGSFVTTYPLSGGQSAIYSMFFSRSTNTVLMTDRFEPVFGATGGFPAVYERDLSGNLVRTFYAFSPIEAYGITRGPNGEVYATDVSTLKIHRWQADGTYLGSIDTSVNVTLPIGIVWAGNALAPTAGSVKLSGRVLTSRGAGVAGALVTLVDSRGAARAARTNTFGYYAFEGVDAGESCVLSAQAKGFRYDPQVVTASEDLTEINFTPQSAPRPTLGARKAK